MQTFFPCLTVPISQPSSQNIHQEHAGLAVARFWMICSHGPFQNRMLMVFYLEQCYPGKRKLHSEIISTDDLR